MCSSQEMHRCMQNVRSFLWILFFQCRDAFICVCKNICDCICKRRPICGQCKHVVWGKICTKLPIHAVVDYCIIGRIVYPLSSLQIWNSYCFPASKWGPNTFTAVVTLCTEYTRNVNTRRLDYECIHCHYASLVGLSRELQTVWNQFCAIV